jgi:hypothetical protein
MTLLTIATNIAKDTKSGELPTTIYGNSNNTAVLLFSAIRIAELAINKLITFRFYFISI